MTQHGRAEAEGAWQAWWDGLPPLERNTVGLERQKRHAALRAAQPRTRRERVGRALVAVGLGLALLSAVPVALVGLGGRNLLGVLLLAPAMALCVLGSYLAFDWFPKPLPMTPQLRQELTDIHAQLFPDVDGLRSGGETGA